jgi:hypothetical protein
MKHTYHHLGLLVLLFCLGACFPLSAFAREPKPALQPQTKGNIRVTLLSVSTGLFYAWKDEMGRLVYPATPEPTHSSRLKAYHCVEVYFLVERLEDVPIGPHRELELYDADGRRWMPDSPRGGGVAHFELDYQCMRGLDGQPFPDEPRPGVHETRILLFPFIFEPHDQALPRPLTIKAQIFGEPFTFKDIQLP